MKLKLISVGKTRARYWQLAEADFRQRIGRYAALTEVTVKDAGLDQDRDADRIKAAEGAEIAAQLQSGEYVISTDRGGEALTSVEFAGLLDQKMLHGQSRFAFVVGGPLGLSDDLLKRSDFRLSLSKMTFVHEMAKVILLEQIYRAFTILNRERYHK